MASGVIAGGRLGTGVGGAKELAGVKGVLHGDPKNNKKLIFNDPLAQCLKITEKVAFNIASQATFIF